MRRQRFPASPWEASLWGGEAWENRCRARAVSIILDPVRILSQIPSGDIEHQASLGMHKHRSSSCRMEPGKSRVQVGSKDPILHEFFMDISSQLLQMYPVTVAMVGKWWKCDHQIRTSSRTTINSWTKLVNYSPPGSSNPRWAWGPPQASWGCTSLGRLDNSKQQKFQKTSPKLCKTKGDESLHYKKIQEVYHHYIYSHS